MLINSQGLDLLEGTDTAARLRHDLPTLYPDSAEQDPHAGDKAPHAYTRKPDGWIAVTPMQPNLKADYEARGFEYLRQYGTFNMGTGDPKSRGRELDLRGREWNPATEPWREILLRGGAKEFPVSQVIAYNWHLRPPYREAEFPQLQGIDITTYECPECEKPVLFSSTNKMEAARRLRIHLTSKISDQHAYSVADLQSLGEELGVDFTRRRVGAIQVPQETESAAQELGAGALGLEGPEPERDLQHACAECGWAPVANTANPAGALRLHMRKHA